MLHFAFLTLKLLFEHTLLNHLAIKEHILTIYCNPGINTIFYFLFPPTSLFLSAFVLSTYWFISLFVHTAGSRQSTEGSHMCFAFFILIHSF